MLNALSAQILTIPEFSNPRLCGDFFSVVPMGAFGEQVKIKLHLISEIECSYSYVPGNVKKYIFSYNRSPF